MRGAHGLLVLVGLAAVALTGCGVNSFTTVEAKDATDGATGFLFDAGPDVRGAVTVREVAPGYDVHVSFKPKAEVMPEISDVRVALDATRWGRAVPVAPQDLSVEAVSCSPLAACSSIGSTAVLLPRGRALPGDDLVLTLSYIEEVDGRPSI